MVIAMKERKILKTLSLFVIFLLIGVGVSHAAAEPFEDDEVDEVDEDGKEEEIELAPMEEILIEESEFTESEYLEVATENQRSSLRELGQPSSLTNFEVQQLRSLADERDEDFEDVKAEYLDFVESAEDDGIENEEGQILIDFDRIGTAPGAGRRILQMGSVAAGVGFMLGGPSLAVAFAVGAIGAWAFYEFARYYHWDSAFDREESLYSDKLAQSWEDMNKVMESYQAEEEDLIELGSPYWRAKIQVAARNQFEQGYDDFNFADAMNDIKAGGVLMHGFRHMVKQQSGIQSILEARENFDGDREDMRIALRGTTDIDVTNTDLISVTEDPGTQFDVHVTRNVEEDEEFIAFEGSEIIIAEVSDRTPAEREYDVELTYENGTEFTGYDLYSAEDGQAGDSLLVNFTEPFQGTIDVETDGISSYKYDLYSQTVMIDREYYVTDPYSDSHGDVGYLFFTEDELRTVGHLNFAVNDDYTSGTGSLPHNHEGAVFESHDYENSVEIDRHIRTGHTLAGLQIHGEEASYDSLLFGDFVSEMNSVLKRESQLFYDLEEWGAAMFTLLSNNPGKADEIPTTIDMFYPDPEYFEELSAEEGMIVYRAWLEGLAEELGEDGFEIDWGNVTLSPDSFSLRMTGYSEDAGLGSEEDPVVFTVMPNLKDMTIEHGGNEAGQPMSAYNFGQALTEEEADEKDIIDMDDPCSENYTTHVRYDAGFADEDEDPESVQVVQERIEHGDSFYVKNLTYEGEPVDEYTIELWNFTAEVPEWDPPDPPPPPNGIGEAEWWEKYLVPAMMMVGGIGVVMIAGDDRRWSGLGALLFLGGIAWMIIFAAG